MKNLPSPNCYITPPNPNVQSEIPTINLWMQRGRESRDTDRLRAGTVPRISGPGGPSGTKPVSHNIPVWLVWMMSTDDPDIDNLFPGMVWAIQDVLRSVSAGANDAVAADPVLLTDPWTSQQSWLIDIGEEMSYETYDRLLEDQRSMRLDAVIDLSVVEVIAA